jgi:hypothetical protein
VPSTVAHDKEAFRLEARCLKPEIALAVLASTADPRILRELPPACERLKVAIDRVLELARGLSIELSAPATLRPNTVVPGTWLRSLIRTGRTVQAKASLDRLSLASGPRPERRRRDA